MFYVLTSKNAQTCNLKNVLSDSEKTWLPEIKVDEGGDGGGADMTPFYVWDILFTAIVLVAVIGNLIVIWIVFGKK